MLHVRIMPQPDTVWFTTMLTVTELSKNYGDIVAVDRISFSAAKGQIFGLLGPNGAGKSTTINCIAGLLQPTSGHATVAGHDVVADGKAARGNLGVVPQELALYDDLPAVENLRYWGRAYGLGGQALEDRVNAVLETIGLGDRAREDGAIFRTAGCRHPGRRRS